VLLAVGIVCVGSMPVDARPALAICVFVTVKMLPIEIYPAVSGAGIVELMAFLAIVAVVAAPAVWLLRRQSAQPGRLAR
jgi:hypothetical protein